MQVVCSDIHQSHLLPYGTNQAFVAACSASDNGECDVVAARVRLEANLLAARLLELSVRQASSIEMPSLHAQCTARRSSSYGELLILRKLSQYIEYCVGNRSLRDVASRVLADLRKLLDVEALCLIETNTKDRSNSQRLGKFVLVEGSLPLEQEFWLDLLDGLQQQAHETLVRNPQNSVDKNGPHDAVSVRSFLLTPIRKENQLFGWLLAVSKRVSLASTSQGLDPLRENDLGSLEAPLAQVAARIIGAQAANHQMFEALEQLVVDVIQTLVGVVEAKDNYTSGHSNRVAEIARHLAEQMRLSPEETMDLITAGLLHDIGKIGVRDEVLNKPGPLTHAEFEEIKQHPTIGVQLLEKIKPLEKYLPGVLYHHESVDGSGYPHGLKGDQIPLMARVLAVADSARTSPSLHPMTHPDSSSAEACVNAVGCQRPAD